MVIPALTSLGEEPSTVAPFFPVGSEDGPASLSEFRVEWYSKHVRAMREPSLWELSRKGSAATTYRFLLLPSFTHPIAVRVTKDGTGATLRAVVMSGKGGYLPGRPAIDHTLRLDAAQWAELEKQVEAANFWTLPTKERDDSGSDGEQYIVEGLSGGRYHVVDRWEPDASYARLVNHIFSLSGLKGGGMPARSM